MFLTCIEDPVGKTVRRMAVSKRNSYVLFVFDDGTVMQLHPEPEAAWIGFSQAISPDNYKACDLPGLSPEFVAEAARLDLIEEEAERKRVEARLKVVEDQERYQLRRLLEKYPDEVKHDQ